MRVELRYLSTEQERRGFEGRRTLLFGFRLCLWPRLPCKNLSYAALLFVQRLSSLSCICLAPKEEGGTRLGHEVPLRVPVPYIWCKT